MKTLMALVLLVLIVVTPALSGCQKKSDSAIEAAEAMEYTTAEVIEIEGAGNLYKVSDELYRGEQPATKGFKELQSLGIKTVVNLRAHHSDTDELKGMDLNYVSIPMDTWDPELEHVQAFLEVVTDDTKQPVFVHCMHGSDRTGTMVAVYRMVVQDWEKEKAIEEMTKGPFGYHKMWKGLPEFLRELDVEELKKNYMEKAPAD